MNDYLNENEQWEAIKAWWSKNGVQLLIIAVIAVSVGLGWRYWQSHVIEQKEQASQLFDQLLSVQKMDATSPKINTISDELQKHYTRTVYAPLSKLFEAKSSILKQNLQAAEVDLQWAIDHFKKLELRQIAQIRLARVLLADKKPDQAMALLERLEGAVFSPLVEQIKGDIYRAKGDKVKAREAYQKALSGIPNTQPLYHYVEMELNELPALS